MKTIFFIRHAKSSWANPGLRDMDRPLNDRGMRDAPRMAILLKALGVTPDRILSSPARRALTTATFFAEELGIPPAEIWVEPRIYDAYPEDIISLLQELPDEYKEVLIFGHNPTFTLLANSFGGPGTDNVPTCGIFRVDAAIDQWVQLSESRGRVMQYLFPKANE
ncbi:MAG: histidine phosphatase family protein [Lewinellaceae bacterium]|nr:histidine phosphatase family protein [Lewinellaceae bacterium]